MSSQGGLKHVATEPAPLESKRERRRGAAGRAAALRRAPSDSDCSGETASLSADSGDRVVRPVPLPTRSGKTRNRRRGSEWEVLEGLKDGQRFEKRPEVFNGYLHKKRKWPLKGWHKRFFVIDGGILVYARSPTDVARGRLHGSVDVGLSVISAKARRRRIDIDADEFIYHLRAKTPDVFRTWLNVLKAHRLYRQHLLTFGARESVPKIHAPIDDLPPADTSSRTSNSSTSSINSSENQINPIVCNQSVVSPSFNKQSIADVEFSHYNTDPILIEGWCRQSNEENNLLPLNFDTFSEKILETNLNCYTLVGTSVCSLNDVEDKLTTQRYDSLIISKSTEHEKQMISTELSSIKSTEPHIGSLLLGELPLSSQLNVSTRAFNDQVQPKKHTKDADAVSDCSNFKDKSLRFDFKFSTTPAFFFFTRKKENRSTEKCLMRSSRKSTNLFKYRNISEEPPLKKPLSKCILLDQFKLKVTAESESYSAQRCYNVCDRSKQNNEIHLKSTDNKHDKASQVIITECDYDKITEKLIVSIFSQRSNTDYISNNDTLKICINEMLKELYNVKLNNKNLHPVKTLFRCLLEYWLKNNCVQDIKDGEKRMISVNTQSDRHLIKDEIVSNVFIGHISKATQFYGVSDINNETREKSKKSSKKSKKYHELQDETRTRHIIVLDDKEKCIQELERLLKSTVYICETVNGNKSKEKDIKITKTLIDNLGKISRKSVLNKSDENNCGETSNSSSEIPKLQETINHLISETSIPPEIAKDFLSAYLDVLQHYSDKSNSTVTQSTETSNDSQKRDSKPKCDVEAKAVQKQISRSITTLNNNNENVEHDKSTNKDINLSVDPTVDSGQLYLRDMINKITTIFAKVNKIDSKVWQKDVPSTDTKCEGTENEVDLEDILDRTVKEYSEKKIISENREENTVVINLSKYDLQHISMTNKPINKGITAITIKMKEKLFNSGEAKHTNLRLKFPNNLPRSLISKVNKYNPWLAQGNITKSNSSHIFESIEPSNLRNLDLDPNMHKDNGIFKPYLSSSDDASTAYRRILHESERSLGLSFQSSNFFRSDQQDSKKSFEGFDAQSCYMMSTIKKTALSNKLQSKKVRLKEISSPNTRSQNTDCPNRSPVKSVQIKSAEVSVLDKPAPRIIDERFILLLLENLTLLSRNVPGIHKDINNLYIKLKKKHEKVLKETHNSQGLGLLGKIYNEEYSNNVSKATNDANTQYDVFYYRKKDEPVLIHAAIQYEANIPVQMTQFMKTAKAIQPIQVIQSVQAVLPTKSLIKKACVDESLSAYRVYKKTYSCAIQTKSTTYINKIINTTDNEDEQTILSSKRSTSKSISVTQTPNQNKFIEDVSSDANNSLTNSYMKVCSRDRAINAVMKYRLDDNDDSKHNFLVIAQGPNISDSEAPKSSRSEHIQPIASDDLINELSLLYPSFKGSTQSQTDKQLVKLNADKDSNKDFTVYQLFVSAKYAATKSCSATESTAKIKDVSDDLKTIYRCSSDPSFSSGLVSPTCPIRGPQAGFVSGTPGGRLASWIIESGGPLENASRELGQAQLSVQQLQRLLDALELQQQVHHDTDVSLEGASPNVKKDRRKFGLRKKKSNTKCASVELAPPHHIDVSSSHTALSTLTAPPSPGGGASSVPNSAASLPIACAAARPQSLPGAEVLSASHTAAGPTSLTSLTPDHQLREDFTVLAKDLLASLKGIVATLVCERGRLRAAMEAADTTTPGGGAIMVALRTNLTSALHQNSELRSRLSRIHDASDLAEISSVGPNSDPVNRQFQQSLSYSSSCVSASEFFDAEEYEEDELKDNEIIAADEAGVIELDGDSSSEAGSLSSGEEGSASSDNSDVLSAEPVTLRVANGVESRPPSGWSRRIRLPCPRPTPGGPSLWNLLYKNIGKDLSQISMPVTINEPLNMLQRLCEELEYSELLDSACDCSNPVERIALIAAFAVSAYASSAHRAASKPFNPLLAETYECVRDDRGFKFIAEQVSHHPPISACHAESPRWCFWQEARIKTKFWGKSMEFQPTGRVHVRLLKTGDHYSWNKVTTCVHNLFGGQRWVDQYGDMHITCHGTDITCKLNFIKASSWSSSRHEVRGAVTGGGARLRLQGRWSEALYAGEPPAARCLWRPGAMPREHEVYYGFTRFAMELNEMEPGMREVLPHTDTRLRPDQRALEEGDVESAEQLKHELEQAQRERRRDYPDHAPMWFRKICEGGEETWVFTGEYWKAREAGFTMDLPSIW